jgi:hypothetical protein
MGHPRSRKSIGRGTFGLNAEDAELDSKALVDELWAEIQVSVTKRNFSGVVIAPNAVWG